jgi:GNAT superfamily N-acetyltransferase
MEVRVATERDLDAVTGLLTAAFAGDPVWGWAFPSRADLETWWRFNIRSALRFPWVWILGDFAAVSMWIPPGESELTAGEEAQVEPMIEDLVGSRAPQVIELLGRFESSHPAEPPHYYLSLLGTDPAHRGHGHGMALLEQNLATIDAEGMPAYLESSNPANDPRYERLGFRRVGEFTRPDGQLTVATMWRDPRGTAERKPERVARLSP